MFSIVKFGSGSQKKAPESLSAVTGLFSKIKDKIEESTHEIMAEIKNSNESSDEDGSTTPVSTKPPWDEIPPKWKGRELLYKDRILGLSQFRQTFKTDPPADATTSLNYYFNFDEILPQAMSAIEGDARLSQMRFLLVPRVIKEERFWRNYFYHVHMVAMFETEFNYQIDDAALSIQKQKSGKQAASTPREMPTSIRFPMPPTSSTHELSPLSSHEIQHSDPPAELLATTTSAHALSSHLINTVNSFSTKFLLNLEVGGSIPAVDVEVFSIVKGEMDGLAHDCVSAKQKVAKWIGEISEDENLMKIVLEANDKLQSALRMYMHTSNQAESALKRIKEGQKSTADQRDGEMIATSANGGGESSTAEGSRDVGGEEFVSDDKLLSSSLENEEEWRAQLRQDLALSGGDHDDSYFGSTKMPWEEEEEGN